MASNTLTNNTLTDRSASALQQTLALYVQQLNELHEILMRERDLLAELEPARYQVLLEHKTNLLQEVAQLDTNFVNQLKKTLKQPTRAVIEQLFANYHGPFAHALVAQWYALQTKLLACQRLNEINAQIVSHSQRHYNRLGAILRQQDPDETIYGKSGRYNNSSLGGSWVQA